jgi:hypothetical protein
LLIECVGGETKKKKLKGVCGGRSWRIIEVKKNWGKIEKMTNLAKNKRKRKTKRYGVL